MQYILTWAHNGKNIMKDLGFYHNKYNDWGLRPEVVEKLKAHIEELEKNN